MKTPSICQAANLRVRRGESLSVAAMRVSNEDRCGLGIVDHLRRRFARFKLCAHFAQARSKRVNLLLLVRRSRLEVLLLVCHRRL
jgi:hypothetical protein